METASFGAATNRDAARYAWRVPSSSYRRISVPLRTALLMPLAALIVHQLRYYLVFGVHTPSRLARDGHAYLSLLEPYVLLAVTIATGGFAGRMVQAWRSNPSGAPAPRALSRGALSSTLRTWMLLTAVLIALYSTQELAEGMFAAGHAAGLAGIVGHGGLIAAPLAVLVGGLLTLVLRGADSLLELVVARSRARHRAPARPVLARRQRPRGRGDWRLEPASGLIAGRAPPLARTSHI